MVKDLVQVNNEVDGFGYPLSNRLCGCGNHMHRVAETTRHYGGGLNIGFVGYKCFRCGHEDIVHESGGVLGYGKKELGVSACNFKL